MRKKGDVVKSSEIGLEISDPVDDDYFERMAKLVAEALGNVDASMRLAVEDFVEKYILSAIPGSWRNARELPVPILAKGLEQWMTVRQTRDDGLRASLIPQAVLDVWVTASDSLRHIADSQFDEPGGRISDSSSTIAHDELGGLLDKLAQDVSTLHPDVAPDDMRTMFHVRGHARYLSIHPTNSSQADQESEPTGKVLGSGRGQLERACSQTTREPKDTERELLCSSPWVRVVELVDAIGDESPDWELADRVKTYIDKKKADAALRVQERALQDTSHTDVARWRDTLQSLRDTFGDTLDLYGVLVPRADLDFTRVAPAAVDAALQALESQVDLLSREGADAPAISEKRTIKETINSRLIPELCKLAIASADAAPSFSTATADAKAPEGPPLPPETGESGALCLHPGREERTEASEVGPAQPDLGTAAPSSSPHGEVLSTSPGVKGRESLISVDSERTEDGQARPLGAGDGASPSSGPIGLSQDTQPGRHPPEHVGLVSQNDVRDRASEGREHAEREDSVEEEVRLGDPALLARYVEASDAKSAVAEANRLSWHLLAENEHLGLAHSLALAVQGLGLETDELRLDARLVEGLILAERYASTTDRLAEALDHDVIEPLSSNSFGAVLSMDALGHGPVGRSILTACSLRPAFLSSSTAIQVIQSLSPGDGCLHDYLSLVVEFGREFTGVSPEARQGLRDSGALGSALKEMAEGAARWLADARARKLKYVRATQVWQTMISDGGEIYRLVRPVQDNDATQLHSVAQLASRLSHSYAVDNLIDGLSDQLAHARHARIEAHPRERLETQVEQAVEIATKWVNLHSSLSEDLHGTHAPKYSSLKSRIVKAETALLEELTQEVTDQTLSVECRAAKAQLQSAVVTCRTDYEFRRIQTFEVEEPETLLNWELLNARGVTLGSEVDEWIPQERPLDVLGAIGRYLAASPPSWRSTLERCIKDEDYVSVDMILGLPASVFSGRVEPIDDAERVPLQRKRDAELRLSVERVLRACDEVSARVEGEYGRLLLSNDERLELSDRVELLRHRIRLGNMGRFAEARRVLDAVERDEESAVQENLQRQQIELLSSPELDHDPELRSRVEAALSDRQVPAAFELVYQGKQAGVDLMDSASRFEELFGDGPEKAEPALWEKLQEISTKSGRSTEIVRKVIALRRTKVPGPQEESAEELLNQWVNCRRQEAAPFELVRKILTGLGFQNIDSVSAWPSAKQNVEARVRMYQLILSSPIEDRVLCPLPRYGSEAKNGYRLVCIWGHMTEGEMSGVLTGKSAEPTIVFYFFPMTLRSRRDYARLTLEEPSRAALILDETLLLYLCGERGSRLPGFFECTLPFVTAQPYVLRAGEVLPEMFYGRRQEIDSLLDITEGSCLVYGGRQVGKTALLRTAERLFQQGNANHKAIWVDLKAKHGITEWLTPAQLMDELTVLLAEALRSHGMLESKSKIPARWDLVLKAIQHWIDGNRDRQLLLLLDEADGLLQVDERQHYLAVGALKSLMDETQRRFKVVFAGLHNVRRMTHSGNQPFAHLGDPICVGALMDSGWTTGGSETREAIELVRRPLAALGYYFKSESLIWLILARTCYFTSWIQTYCKALLADLNARRRILSVDVSVPPYYINAEDVDRVYESESVKQGLHELFRLTLELDPRYQILVYLLGADMIVQEHTEFIQGGYPVSWLRDEAVKYWDSGLGTDLSEGTVRVLLDELVGLGVLRLVGEGRYKLYGPSTLMLLGKDYDGMVEGLTNPVVESPIGVPPEEFRITLDETEDHLSPLTLDQTRRVLTCESGVAVIAGCDLAGIDDSLRALSTPPFRTSELVSDAEVSAFGHDLEKALESVSENSSMAIVVGPQTPWSMSWVTRAESIIDSMRLRSRTVRVVFVADAAKAYSVLTEAKPDLGVVSLRPWGRPGVRWWLEAQNAPTSRLDEILQLTRGWPALLYQLNQKRRRQARVPFDMAIEELTALLAKPADLWLGALKDLSPVVAAHRDVFQAMAWLKPYDTGELEANCKGVSRETIERCVRWTAVLSLARESGSAGVWELDDVFRDAVASFPA